jgi:hypothetical protein
LSSFTNSPTKGRLSSSSTKLPTYMLAMIAQMRVDSFDISWGPGCRPYMVKTNSSSAVVGDPGMPRVNSGTMPPPTPALLAASGPATASMAPLPNSSGFFDSRFSSG